MSPTTARRIARAFVTAFMLAALYLSASHIAHLFESWGVTNGEQYLAPAFIDAYMVLGKLLGMKCWTRRTRTLGGRMVVSGALMSLTANVLAGGTPGARILGALVVVGFLVGEYALANMVATAPARPRTPKPAAPAAPAKRAGRKCQPGCTCGKHNRKRTAPKPPVPAAAPVSPAPGGRMVGGLWVARNLAEARQ